MLSATAPADDLPSIVKLVALPVSGGRHLAHGLMSRAARRALWSVLARISTVGFRCQVLKTRGQLLVLGRAGKLKFFVFRRVRKIVLDENLHQLHKRKLTRTEPLTPFLLFPFEFDA